MFVIQLIGLRVLAYFPGFVEKYYSSGIYPTISKMLRYTFGWIPFSAGDIIYTVLTVLALRWLYFNFRLLFKKPLYFCVEIAATLSVMYFVFNLFWGFNYYRIPLHQTLELERDYTTEQLIEITERLIEKSNELHRELGFSDSLKVDFPYSQKEIFAISTNGYENLSKEFPTLSLTPKSVKTSLWSLGLTYMGNSGYYNPFTGEAHVNKMIVEHRFPVVTLHEEAHQLGYAAENEANFLAFLASVHHDDRYFQYSGYIFALRYCLNELARRDMEYYEETLKTVNFGILESYREARDFWNSYQTPLENASKWFFDIFLKANNQSKGLQSYSYMVALVINYFEEKPL